MAHNKDKRQMAFIRTEVSPYFVTGRVVEETEDGMVIIVGNRQHTLVVPYVITSFAEGVRRLQMLHKFMDSNSYIKNPLYEETKKLIAQSIVLHAKSSIGL